jgi:Peptidase C10 family/Spi protease inhibitor
MKNVFRVLSSLVITSTILFSCQKEIVKELIPNNGNDYAVTLDEAKVICQNNNGNTKARIGADKTILSAKSKKNKNGEDIYHVITYDNNKGYKVISADKRAFPLLVESDNGQFDTTIPSVEIWMHGLEGYIEKQKLKKIAQSEDKYLKSIWKDFEDSGDALKQIKTYKNGVTANKLPGDGGGGSNCQDTYQANENVLNTNWAQWGGFNNFCPPNPCGLVNGYCGRVPAGCGPVAMAQIMFRYQRPLEFNFANMTSATNNPFTCTFNAGQIEIARLIKYAGDKAGSTPITTNIPFSCSTSTSTFPWAIPSAFSDAGYSSGGNSQDYIFSNIVNDLLQGFPVIVSGTKGWVGNASEWHIWVADGVRYWTYSQDCISQGMVHFNMGWGGSSNNWYYSPYSMGYDTQVKSITNIRP